MESDHEASLTKHLKLTKAIPPLYTGGSFAVLRDERTCVALRDAKICIFDSVESRELATLAPENEEIVCFAVSPNQQLIALSNKNYMIRVFAMPEEGWQFEQVKQFKTTGQMVLELAFDPSSRFLAAGTADSGVKVFDVAKGF